jgi:AraC-like DNA-binding protein
MTDTAHPAPVLRFTTRDVAAPARSRALWELREQGLLPIEPLLDRVPAVDLLKWRLPGTSILAGTFAGVRQGDDPGLAGADELCFGINLSGVSLAVGSGREIPVGAGEAIAAVPGAGPFRVLRAAPARMVGVRLRRRDVPVDPIAAGRAPLLLVPATTAALPLLAGYLRTVVSGAVLSSAPLADAVAAHIAELIALSLEPTGASTPPAGDRGVRAARLTAIKADIDRHLLDGPLTVAALAARHGISPRYLHALFEDEGTTCSRYVLDRRLAVAHRRLRDPRFVGRTISAIAHDSGFGDLSYFNRTFRRRYEVTPSEARRAGPGSADRRADRP